MTWTLNKEEEEAIYKKRLIYDGHGTGEDKRLISLSRNIIKLCLKEDTNDALIKLLNAIDKEINGALNAAEKHERVLHMCDRTFISLEAAIEDKTKQIELVKSDLAKLDLDIEYAEKQNQLKTYPDCQSTEKAMKELELRKESLMGKIQNHRRNMEIIIEACRNLQKVIDDDFRPEPVDKRNIITLNDSG